MVHAITLYYSLGCFRRGRRKVLDFTQRLPYLEFYRSSRMIVIPFLDERVAFIYDSSLTLIFIFFAFPIDVFVANSVPHVRVTSYIRFFPA
jgi:hypothetical protein